MKRYIPWLAIYVLALATMLPTGAVHADAGPKPAMNFRLVWAISHVSVSEASLYTCEDEACASPQKVFAPFTCSEESCRYNYGDSGFYKLEIAFADKTRISNVFEKRGYTASFDVNINADDLLVQQVSFPFPYIVSLQLVGFFLSSLASLAIEIPLAVWLLKRWNLPRKWSLILVANLITLPIVWFVFPFTNIGVILIIVLAEVFAWLFEAALYFQNLRKDGLTVTRALLLSLFANLASLFLPVLCLMALGPLL